MDFRLPDVGEGLEEAEIVEWLVVEGSEVGRDQPLVEILTDKSQTQLPSPVAGRVVRLGFDEGDMARVGDVLVVIDDGMADTVTTPAEVPLATPASATAISPLARAKASPAVRRRAREAGIDLVNVTASGPGGRVTQGDLDAHISAATRLGGPEPTDALTPAVASVAPPPASSSSPGAASGLGQLPVGTHPLRGVRRVTARNMERAWDIPHIHGQDEIDATALLAARDRLRASGEPLLARLSPMPLLMTAVAHALRRFPLVNAAIDTADDTITVHPSINIGMAVATESGLLVPVVREVDRLRLVDLVTEIDRLVSATRDRTLTPTEMQGGTCTVTNYGSLGGRFASPIIRSPEVAIVGFGSIRERPVAIDGEVVARPTLPIVTGVDHRLIDGDLATAFQEHIADLLRDPVLLLA